LKLSVILTYQKNLIEMCCLKSFGLVEDGQKQKYGN
jgi:hypothetical protein